MTIFLFLLSLTMNQSTDPLSGYRWENRILLIFANEKEQSEVKNQLQHFKTHHAGLKERDLILFEVYGDKGSGPEGTLESEEVDYLQSRFNPQGDYTIILVGKDGGEKLRQSKLLDHKKLFATIDAMPMRQSEMRRQGN